MSSSENQTPARSENAPVDAAVDAVIIGGGIAGSALAIVLKREGMDVALVEREATFRDRIRGEATHPWGVREIDNLGLRPFLDEAGAVELPLWTRYRDRVASDPYAWTTDVPDSPPELGFSHPRLQETLLQAAISEGARVFRPARTTPVRSGDSWLLEIESADDTHMLRARLLVGADGKNSATRKVIGAKAMRDAIHHQFGGLLLKGVDLPADSAHQGYHDAGFAMLFPQGNGHARTYYVAPNAIQRELLGPGGIQDYIQRVAACFPEGALSRAEPTGPMGFFPNADIAVDRIAGENAVLIGDAAGANDPTQGHGTSLAFRDIRVLRDALLGDPATAPERYGEERKAYYHVLRTHAAWAAPLITDTGDVADALRDQVREARDADPAADGYGNIFANGPDGLPTDDEARRRFYGEHLPGARVRTAPKLTSQQGRRIGPPPE